MSNPAKARAQVCAPPSPCALRVGLAVGLGLGLCLVVGCSDDAERRDQYYGTDTGVGYQLPDTGRPTDASDASDAGAGGADVTGSQNDAGTNAADASPDGDGDAGLPPAGPDATVDGGDDDASAAG